MKRLMFQRLLCVFLYLGLGHSSYAQQDAYIQEIDEFRTVYKELIQSAEGPLDAENIQDLHFYPADASFKVQAKAELINDPNLINMPTSSGKNKSFTRYAKLSFSLQGQELTLTVFKSAQPGIKAFLFLPFTDQTNGEETYHGGRYLDLAFTDFKGNAIEIDFNKTYNPYCAFSEGYNCPMPPEENSLPVAIQAGEKNYTGVHKQRKMVIAKL